MGALLPFLWAYGEVDYHEELLPPPPWFESRYACYSLLLQKMTILHIESIFQDEFGVVNVNAIVEDMVVVIPQTHNYPAEYGSALCEASFELEENETLPDNEDDLVQFLESLNLDWSIIDTSDY